ncbi:hypothetical protein [Brevundimonas denitrificans]|uniref:hypothetical protein n=1 Tax=Brevundimonas denitrificans TaxID=1443434 RepID=UPI00223B78D3|nr:hypothetical protein [Brevundimonas denitrificans]
MTTIEVPANKGLDKTRRRRTILARSAILFILGPTILYALYLLLLAPAQYQTSTSFAVRAPRRRQWTPWACWASRPPRPTPWMRG